MAGAGLAIVAFSAGACRSSATPSETSRLADADSALGSLDALSTALPALTIDNRGPGQFVLRFGASIKLATQASIEHQSGDAQWAAYPVLDSSTAYRLVATCNEADLPPCRTFGAGALFVPEPWSGYSCSSQCGKNCDKNIIQPGVHRLVVSTCDDARVRYEGPPFEIPREPDMLVRKQAASNVVSATICRVDPRGAAEPTEKSADRRAGFKVVPGSENMLEVDGRSELVKWLRGASNFKDGAEYKKEGCARRQMVGFLLKSVDESGKEAATELALDFGCNTLTLARDRGSPPTSSSLFEPSRAIILGIAGRGLPNDAELGRLK
jgi:hypothetical protein